MNKFFLVGAIAITLTLGACSEDAKPNFEIVTYDRMNKFVGMPYAQVEIRAVDDSVTIEQVIFNRGNCETREQSVVTGRDVLPATIKFGEKLVVESKTGCEASEIEIVSSEGAWVYSY